MAAEANAEVQEVAVEGTAASGDAAAQGGVGAGAGGGAAAAPVGDVVLDAAGEPVAVEPGGAAVGGEGVRRKPAVGAGGGALRGGALLERELRRRGHLIEYVAVAVGSAGAERRREDRERGKSPPPMNSQAEHRIQAEDGTPLSVRVLRAPSPRGWVIVLHGLDDHLRRYEALAGFLRESGYDVVLYDQRGHGASGGARTHVEDFGEYVDDLLRVCDAEQPGRDGTPHLFAHSMGSVVALLAAKRHPDRWRSLVVQGFPLLPGRNIPKALAPVVRALPLLARLRVASGLRAEDLSRDPAVVEAYRRDPQVQGKVSLGWGAAFLAALEELREGAAGIKCPLLVLHGEDDAIARAEGARWLAGHAGAADLELLTYPGLKHELHNEPAPERSRVFADIRAWLDRH